MGDVILRELNRVDACFRDQLPKPKCRLLDGAECFSDTRQTGRLKRHARPFLLRQALDSVSKGQRKLDLAQRLTGALSSENDRWAENVIQLRADMELLTGDVLLAASFIRCECRVVLYRIGFLNDCNSLSGYIAGLTCVPGETWPVTMPSQVALYFHQSC